MGLCGSSEDANPMPDTLLNWAGLFNQLEKRIRAKPQSAQPFYLVVLLECAEFKWSELKDPESKEAAYTLLEQALVDFHRAKAEDEEKEREEKKKQKQRKSQVFGDRDKLPESEIDEMLKQKQASRLLKIVVRFMQRKLKMWNHELKKEKITSTALKDEIRYACVDGEPPDDDDSDKEEDDKGDPFTKGWIPAPKDDIRLDQMDTFQVGDLDFYQLSAGDPTGLFFKLRYGCRLVEIKKDLPKAIEVVDKAKGLADEALSELEREWEAKLVAEEKEREKEKQTQPRKSLGGKKEEQKLIDPNAELRDVTLMCRTKLSIWRTSVTSK